jgi:PBP1b-binding outer membrane lipoprotein LpoB
MKKIAFILVITFLFQACAQNNSIKYDHESTTREKRNNNDINFTGEFNGTFTDLKKEKGTIELFLYQSNNGFSEGIILMTKSDTKIITGVLSINGNGKFLTGNFSPSEIKNTLWSSQNKNAVTPENSYQCGWSFYGEIKDEKGKLIVGKAVPTNCSESNLIEFTLNKKE